MEKTKLEQIEDINWQAVKLKPTTFKPIDPVLVATPDLEHSQNVLMDRTTGRVFGQENTTNNYLEYILSGVINTGAWVMWEINAPSEPIVRYSNGEDPADKIPSTFFADTDMYLVIFSPYTGAANYFFVPITRQQA